MWLIPHAPSDSTAGRVGRSGTRGAGGAASYAYFGICKIRTVVYSAYVNQPIHAFHINT